MPKKKPKRSKNGEDDSLSQPCCVLGCERFGTRLLSSLRDHYAQKENHSGRVCEGHYRRDLRKFKKRQAQLQEVPAGPKREPMNDLNKWDTNMMNTKNSIIPPQAYQRGSQANVSHFPFNYQSSQNHTTKSTLVPMVTGKQIEKTDREDTIMMDYETWNQKETNHFDKFRVFCEFVLKRESVI